MGRTRLLCLALRLAGSPDNRAAFHGVLWAVDCVSGTFGVWQWQRPWLQPPDLTDFSFSGGHMFRQFKCKTELPELPG
jgi:hypothetical protein